MTENEALALHIGDYVRHTAHPAAVWEVVGDLIRSTDIPGPLYAPWNGLGHFLAPLWRVPVFCPAVMTGTATEAVGLAITPANVPEWSIVLTVAQVAETLGVRRQAIQQAITTGRLPAVSRHEAHQPRPVWYVRREDVEAYRETRRPGGRPRAGGERVTMATTLGQRQRILDQDPAGATR